MKRSTHQRIRTKLTRLVMISSCAALLLACLAFVINDVFSYRKAMLQDLPTGAQIIGNNSTAALSCGEPKPVEEIMSALSADPHLVLACVFNAENQILAAYQQPGSTLRLPARAESTRAWF